MFLDQQNFFILFFQYVDYDTKNSQNVSVTFTRITVVLFNEASIFLCDTNTITMVPFLTVVTCSEIQQNPLQSITSHNQLVNLMPLTIIFSTIFHSFVQNLFIVYIQTLTRYTLSSFPQFSKELQTHKYTKMSEKQFTVQQKYIIYILLAKCSYA